MNYYLISGEASGDLHGSNLIRALKKLDDKACFRAWGGDLMREQGATLVKHYSDLAFMGFWEVLKHLPTVLKNISFCKKDILDFQPDVIIYIDYPGFNLRIAEWAKKQGFKNHYYISPQVWAWKENRVRMMKHSLDALYVVLPFEKAFFEEKHDFKVHFVGHPLLDQLDQFLHDPKFLSLHQLDPNKKIIALLPGSRIQEIKKILPLFVQTAAAFEEYQFIVAAAPGIATEKYVPYLKNTSIKIVYNQTYNLLKNSTAALVTSGTATLETALFDVPQLVCYKSSALNYWIGKKIIRLKYIALVNLILNKEAVKELIQHYCNHENLTKQLQFLLTKEKQKQLRKEYTQLKSLLGGGGASQKTAKLIVQSIR